MKKLSVKLIMLPTLKVDYRFGFGRMQSDWVYQKMALRYGNLIYFQQIDLFVNKIDFN